MRAVVRKERMSIDLTDRAATKVVLLGTGTPNAEPDRSGPSVAILVDDTPYLVDFGPGVVRRAAAACRAGVAGLEPRRLSTAFLTHLHSDHTAGYPDLILTPWVLEREEPLEVYGPTGTREMTKHILAAYQEDIEERIAGLEPINESGQQVNVHEIEGGTVYQDSQVEVSAFRVKHGSWPAFGYRFRTAERTIVVSGDTAPAESLIDEYRGCDVLIHEVYSHRGLQGCDPAWRRYHAAVHTSSNELATLASQARPGLLILYHQLLWGVSEDQLLAEIREGYDGQVVSGKDLQVY